MTVPGFGHNLFFMSYLLKVSWAGKLCMITKDSLLSSSLMQFNRVFLWFPYSCSYSSCFLTECKKCCSKNLNSCSEAMLRLPIIVSKDILSPWKYLWNRSSISVMLAVNVFSFFSIHLSTERILSLNSSALLMRSWIFYSRSPSCCCISVLKDLRLSE